MHLMTSWRRFLGSSLLVFELAACDAPLDHEELLFRDEPEISPYAPGNQSGTWPPPGGTFNTAWLGDMPLMRLVPPGSEVASETGDGVIYFIEVFDGEEYLPVTNVAVPNGTLVLTAGGETYTGGAVVGSRWWLDETGTDYIVITAVGEPGVAAGYLLEHHHGDQQDYICEPTRAGSHWSYLVEDIFVDVQNGDITPDSGPLLVACVTGAVGKAITWGFSPWYPGDDTLALYRTGVRTVRADYCGDGWSYTDDGILIQVSNALAGRSFDDPTARTEAIFGPDGAVCLSHARFKEPTLTCTLPQCEEPTESFQAWTKLAVESP